MDLASCREKINFVISEKERKSAMIDETKRMVSVAEKRLKDAEAAQEIIQDVAQETQAEIEGYMTSIVSLALRAVESDDPSVPKPPEFVARAVTRRGTTEFDLLFKEGDAEQDPLESSGYGYVDVADYALRVFFIILKTKCSDGNNRPVLILDEPFRFSDPKLQYLVSSMLHMASDEHGFQQIVVSHGEGVNVDADKLFKVTKSGGISKVEVVGEK